MGECECVGGLATTNKEGVLAVEFQQFGWPPSLSFHHGFDGFCSLGYYHPHQPFSPFLACRSSLPQVLCTHWACGARLGPLFQSVAEPGWIATLERNVKWLDPRLYRVMRLARWGVGVCGGGAICPCSTCSVVRCPVDAAACFPE
jgi:hypothetical protein